MRCVKLLDAIAIPDAYLEGVRALRDQILAAFVTNTFEWMLAELRILYALESYEVTDQSHMTTILPSSFATLIKTLLVELGRVVADHDVVRIH